LIEERGVWLAMVLATIVAVVGFTATGSALATRAVVVGLVVVNGPVCDMVNPAEEVGCFGSAIVTVST
jgi:hypothetical protein